jgi:uncharacterized SAM-binding protein YcdF (DUF218 family)
MRKYVKRMLWVVAVVWLAALLLYGVALARVRGLGNDPVPHSADAAVVLGAGVWPGGVPSPALARRTHAGGQLLLHGRVHWIATTGGVGRFAPAESEVARAYLIREMNIDSNKILLESLSHTTWENLVYIRDTLRAHGIQRVFIVSDGYHLARGVRMARDLGFDAWGVAADGSIVQSLQDHPGRWQKEAALLMFYWLTGFNPSHP